MLFKEQADRCKRQRTDERIFVEHTAAREVDQERRGLHRGEHAVVDDVAGVVFQRHQQHEVIQLGRRLRDLGARVDLVEARNRPVGARVL